MRLFLSVFQLLVYVTDESIKAREAEWVLANTNTQGALSLAMVEEWTQRTLTQKPDDSNCGIVLYKTYFSMYSKAFCAS